MFARVRITLMNGIEAEAQRFGHGAARLSAELREPLAAGHRVEQHQQTMVNRLLHEATEAYLYYSCARQDPNPRVKAISERMLDGELGDFRLGCELCREYERHDPAAARGVYIAEAEPVGAVPAPATLKGVVSSGARMVTDLRPQVFIDRLAERVAFERGGTRLYEGLLAKFASGSRTGQNLAASTGVTEAKLERIRGQEALREEDEHLLSVRGRYVSLSLADSGVD